VAATPEIIPVEPDLGNASVGKYAESKLLPPFPDGKRLFFLASAAVGEPEASIGGVIEGSRTAPAGPLNALPMKASNSRDIQVRIIEAQPCER
jgi:hypothetical protein